MQLSDEIFRHILNLRSRYMKKSIFTIVFIVLITAVIPPAKSETLSVRHQSELVHLLIGKKDAGKSGERRLNKRKLKRAVRKAARIYREIKTDRESKQKSRNVQRKARRIINIF